MGDGKLADKDLKMALDSVAEVPGDFAEVGVYQGQLFGRLAAEAEARYRNAHAFDSFAGMDTPGEHDGEQYPRGALSCGLMEFLNATRLEIDDFSAWPGFVPHCFNLCERAAPHLRFAFAYIDVDHYEPTRQAIEWLWPRISPGGVLGFDDYFPGREFLASKAIGEWLRSGCPGPTAIWETDNNQLFAVKPE